MFKLIIPVVYRKSNNPQHDLSVDRNADQVLAAFVAGQLEALDLLVQPDYVVGRSELLMIHGFYLTYLIT